MRTASSWLRRCEAQKLRNDTARLEESMRDEPEDVPPDDPTDDGDFAYDQWKERQ
jgi:hypothetical protein